MADIKLTKDEISESKWTHEIKEIKQNEGPGVARVTVIYTGGDKVIEKEIKLVAEHFQTIEDVEAEFQRHIDILDNFEVTIELLKQQLNG